MILLFKDERASGDLRPNGRKPSAVHAWPVSPQNCEVIRKISINSLFYLPHCLFGKKVNLPFSKVSKCCKRLVIEHQLGAGGRQGRGGPGGQAHVHCGEDEEEDEADAGRDREVRRRGHLRDDQPAAADVEQDQAKPY